MKPRSYKYVFFAALVLLLAINFYLLYQNNQYRRQNRALILQNDSILSVNLELVNGSAQSSTAHTGE